VVIAQHRGMYRWNTAAVSRVAINAIRATELGSDLTDRDEKTLNVFIKNFLDKLFYQLRNLGQSSPDRALNFSATNVFQAANVFVQVLLPSAAGLVPASPDQKGFYTFDNVAVSKSPFCRFDSDCWDVQLSFFDPVNVLRARLVFQYTVDVSDEMPVTMGTIHSWTQGQSVLT
jgi:PatG C-terminal